MLINVVFENEETDFDIIIVPEVLVDNIESVQQMFFDWLYDESSNHDYWIYKDGAKWACSYGIEEFVEWTNKNILNEADEKITIISQNLTELDNKNPTIYF